MRPSVRHHRSCLVLSKMLMELLATDLHTAGVRRRIAKGASIWRPSDVPDRMYVLERGRIHVVASDVSGKELLLQVVAEAETFGELCFCAEDTGTRDSTAIAARVSEYVEIPYAKVLKLLQKHPQLLNALLMTMCERLNECDLRTEALAHRDAEQRIGRLLLLLARRPHQPERNVAHLVITHNELALLAAMTRSHVTVVMNRFRAAGAVAYGRTGPITVRIGALDKVLAKKG